MRAFSQQFLDGLDILPISNFPDVWCTGLINWEAKLQLFEEFSSGPRVFQKEHMKIIELEPSSLAKKTMWPSLEEQFHII